MNKQLFVAPVLVLLALLGLGTEYGFDVFGDIISRLFHEIIDIVVLLFIVGVLLTLYFNRYYTGRHDWSGHRWY